MGAIEDQIERLGHNEVETDLVVKPPRRASLGVLADYFTQGTEQQVAVEALSHLCTTVKTIVELNGRKRTFNLGGNPSGQVCEVEIDDKITVIAGNPKMDEMHAWCRILMNEFLQNIYPGMGIKV